MHDWTLLAVLFEWEAARVTLSFRGAEAGAASIVAEGVCHLDVPRLNEWGRSVSVNKVRGPADNENSGQRCLEIEMQSGDVITVLARSFVLPQPLADELALLETAAHGE